MKRRIARFAIVLLISGSAMAQTPEEKPRATDTAVATAAADNAAKHAREADARHCLERKTEREIIRCAEPYRYRGTR